MTAKSNREDGTVNERDAKLVQWLNEAHLKEAELEADLTAHIALTEKQSYKKRLQQHLKETRDHKRSVARASRSSVGRRRLDRIFPVYRRLSARSPERASPRSRARSVWRAPP